jgi:hypothetical protein
MGISHRPLYHIDRANEIDSRANRLLKSAEQLEAAGSATGAKAHRHVDRALHHIEHARHHVQDAYAHQCVTDDDRDHYLGLAEAVLDRVETMLNQKST